MKSSTMSFSVYAFLMILYNLGSPSSIYPPIYFRTIFDVTSMHFSTSSVFGVFPSYTILLRASLISISKLYSSSEITWETFKDYNFWLTVQLLSLFSLFLSEVIFKISEYHKSFM